MDCIYRQCKYSTTSYNAGFCIVVFRVLAATPPKHLQKSVIKRLKNTHFKSLSGNRRADQRNPVPHLFILKKPHHYSIALIGHLVSRLNVLQ